MGEIIAADPEKLDSPQYKLFQQQVDTTRETFQRDLDLIGDPVGTRTRGEIDKSAQQLYAYTKDAATGVFDALAGLARGDGENAQLMKTLMEDAEQERVNAAGGGTGQNGSGSR